MIASFLEKKQTCQWADWIPIEYKFLKKRALPRNQVSFDAMFWVDVCVETTQLQKSKINDEKWKNIT